MDTDHFYDGQRAKCETKDFAHSSTQTKPEVAPTAASEGTHLEKQVKNTCRVSQKLRQRNLRPLKFFLKKDLRVYNGIDCKLVSLLVSLILITFCFMITQCSIRD